MLAAAQRIRRSADSAAGVKPVLRAYPPEDVEAGDPGVAEDVDTPDDYSRLIPPAGK